jgi:hypothetical protein
VQIDQASSGTPYEGCGGDTSTAEQERTQERFEEVRHLPLDNLFVSERRIIHLIKQLRTSCSPGVDGITAEHIKHAISTSLPLHRSALFTLCLRFCCLPKDFFTGLITSILKKNHLDPSKPENYRPITVSATLSKLLELYIIEESRTFEPHPAQFEFVNHRGTNTAISLAYDICNYCVGNGSPVYLCSLDAEGAFDCLPHHVLFAKAYQVLPLQCWRILFHWYSCMTAAINWGGCVSDSMPVERGTRQGGLTSPLLFNIFYKGLVEHLDSMDCGITIRGVHYNVFCYADDLLLASTTTTGLQKLINEAVSVITADGLRFNPAKTLCMTFGKAHQKHSPTWSIGDTQLVNSDCITTFEPSSSLTVVACTQTAVLKQPRRLSIASKALDCVFKASSRTLLPTSTELVYQPF